MIENLSKVLPQLFIIAAIGIGLGWALRGLFTKPSASAKSITSPDAVKQERVKNLEAALEKSRSSHKTTKAELDALQAASVPKATLEATVTELDSARRDLEAIGKRIASAESELKKSQETIKHLNGRANEADKAQKDRSFALENELSKTREQLAQFQNRPDDTVGLQAEIDRLRESVANATRFAGEMRKREASAIEAMEKAQARLDELAATPRAATVQEKKIGPVGDSSRVAAAKAEVLRLLEANKQKGATTPAAAVEPETIATPGAAVSETTSAPAEPEPLADDNVSPFTDTPVEEVPATAGTEVHGAPEEDAPDAGPEPIETPEKAPEEPKRPVVQKPAVTGELFQLE